MRRASLLSALVVAALVAATVAAASALTGGPSGKSALQSGGRTSLAKSGGATGTTGPLSTEIPLVEVDEDVPNSGNSAARVPSAGVPRPTGNALAAPGSELLKGFEALNHADQRFAGTGAYTNTNFSLEPPDQALCVGGGKIVEGVNTAFRIYNTDGTPASAIQQYNQFFHLTPPINRVTGVRGDFTSDPKCIYDKPSGRFIMSLLQAGVDPATGGFNGTGGVYFAVSDAGSTTNWSIYHFSTASDGVPGNPGSCPCLGDQPLIGADKYGIYFSVNSFPFFSDGFNGAWIYALSKKSLFSGSLGTVNRYYTGALRDGTAYSTQPATVPSDRYATANGGTEYFLSALDFNASLDNQIAQWSLTNTSALDSGGAPLLQAPKLIDTEVYGQPPAAAQSDAGPFPLLESGAIPLLGEIHPSSYHVALLNSNDDRMNQAVYANGKLWGAVNTVVKTQNGATMTGLAWFEVNPANGTLANQGYVSVNGASLLFPSLAINDAGKGAIAATITSPNMHPSVAYAQIDETHGAGPVRVAFNGPVGEDGFTGYTDPVTGAPVNQKGVARWGDYGAAAVDADGSIWLANETTSLTRSSIANWGTFVMHVRP
jgi:hypothetical protein